MILFCYVFEPLCNRHVIIVIQLNVNLVKSSQPSCLSSDKDIPLKKELSSYWSPPPPIPLPCFNLFLFRFTVVAHFGITALGMKTPIRAFSFSTTDPLIRSVETSMKHTIKTKTSCLDRVDLVVHSSLTKKLFSIPTTKKTEGKKALSCKQQVNWLLRTIATMEQVSCLRLLEIVPKDLLPNTEGQCIIIHRTVRAATLWAASILPFTFV